MRKIVLMLLAVCFLAGSAAAFTPANFERGLDVDSVTGLEGKWIGACAVFTWNPTGDANFNNFVIQTTSNKAAFNSIDANVGSVSRYVFCTVGDGEWIRATVYRVDLNNDGYFRNIEPDSSAQLTAGRLANAGMLLMYSIISTIALLASLIVLAIIVQALLQKIGFDIGKLLRGK